MEVHKYYATHKNYRENATVFGLQDPILRKICQTTSPKMTNKGRFAALKGSKHFKGNKIWAGKPLFYPTGIIIKKYQKYSSLAFRNDGSPSPYFVANFKRICQT